MPTLTTETLVPFQAIPRKTCGQSSAGKGFTPRTSVFAFHYHSTNTPYSFASEYYYCNTRRTRGKAGNLQTKESCFGYQESLHTKVLPRFFFAGFKYQNHFNPSKPELNPICYLLALLGAHHFLHVSRIRVKLLNFRRLMSYIYIYIWSTHS